MLQPVKCNLKHCLNWENGFCEAGVPNILKTNTPNSVLCTFYDTDFKASCLEFKKHGGVLGAVLKNHGKSSEAELKAAKKAMRKSKKEKKEKKRKGLQ